MWFLLVQAKVPLQHLQYVNQCAWLNSCNNLEMQVEGYTTSLQIAFARVFSNRNFCMLIMKLLLTSMTPIEIVILTLKVMRTCCAFGLTTFGWLSGHFWHNAWLQFFASFFATKPLGLPLLPIPDLQSLIYYRHVHRRDLFSISCLRLLNYYSSHLMVLFFIVLSSF